MVGGQSDLGTGSEVDVVPHCSEFVMLEEFELGTVELLLPLHEMLSMLMSPL